MEVCIVIWRSISYFAVWLELFIGRYVLVVVYSEV